MLQDMTRYQIKHSLLNDRFTRGFVAGLIAGVVLFPINMLSKILFNTLSYADFASILIYGHKSKNLLELVFAIGGVFFFEGILGGIFAHLITGITGRNLLFKGWVFSCLVWLGSYAVTLLFKVPGLLDIPFKTALSNFIGATIWGLFLTYALVKLDTRFNK